MLLKIRDFIKQQRIASNQQIAREFKLDLLTLQPMLDTWIGKGIIQICNDQASCGSQCAKSCKTQSKPIYYRFMAASA